MAVNETIGKLDRFVTVVQFTVAADEYNSGTKRTPSPIKNVWAKLVFKSSSESVDEKVFDINKRDYVIHFDTDITDLDLQNLAIIEDEKTYYVTGANPDYGGRKMYVLLNTEYRG